MIDPSTLAAHVAVWFAETAPPTYPAYTGDPDLITPGVVGFVAMFLVAAATVLLIVDMTRRVRRVRYRAEVLEQLEAERAAEAEDAAAAAPDAAATTAGADATAATGDTPKA